MEIRPIRFAVPLEEERKLLVSYLKMKVENEEWHAVWDAAVDLAILDGQIAERKRGA